MEVVWRLHGGTKGSPAPAPCSSAARKPSSYVSRKSAASAPAAASRTTGVPAYCAARTVASAGPKSSAAHSPASAAAQIASPSSSWT